MPKTKFFVHTAMVCYMCRRTAVVSLYQSWREVDLTGNDSEVLDVVFVSCALCLDVASAHNPMTAMFPRHIEPQQYHSLIKGLARRFRCEPSILKERSFSIIGFKSKSVARIYAISEIYNMPEIPDCHITIIENVKQIPPNRRFFTHDCYCTGKYSSKYRHEIDSQSYSSLFSPMVRAPIQMILTDETMQMDLDKDTPPPYSAMAN
jgi:hypothetical protein